MGPNTLTRRRFRFLAGLPFGASPRPWLLFDGDGAGSGGSGGGSGSGDAGGTGDQGGQGGAGDAAAGSGSSGTGDGSGGAQGGAGDGSGGDSGDGSGDGSGDELANLSTEQLAKMVRDLRRENGRSRADAKQQAADEARAELAQTIGKALGLVQDGEEADPEKLAQQLDEERTQREQTAQEARQARVELAVYQAAGTHSADPAALLDSRTFVEKLAKLDPAGDGFADKVGDAIKKAVAENPAKFRAGQAPARSSADHAGGSGEGAKSTANTLAGAVAAHYGQ